jgi:hypothetical protein
MDGKNYLCSGVPHCWLRKSGPGAAIVIFLFTCLATALNAQEMQPRAYLPAPIGVNFFGISYSHNSGGLLFDPSLPVEDAHVVATVGSFSLGQSLGVMGRSAQVLAIVPYLPSRHDRPPRRGPSVPLPFRVGRHGLPLCHEHL